MSLTKERKTAIKLELGRDYGDWKNECEKIWKNDLKGSKTNLYEPSWATFATTNPPGPDFDKKIGVRGCLAFPKIPCTYKKKMNGLGCTHCALSISNKSNKPIKSIYQIMAVQSGLAEITQSLGYTPPVLEILTDGSFLNEGEVSRKTQIDIIDLISKNPSIVKIAIESRPEYIEAKKIRRILNLMRSNQILEIYTGLESVDPFVLGEIIKKGFLIHDYERRIKAISSELSLKEKNRLHFTAYHFFKPPYLTEKESIDAALTMVKKIKSYDGASGISFSVKCEPAVISEGTFQKFLFDRGKYSPPNYFSLAEIIALSHENGFSGHIKFGQRDDIDFFQAVAAVPDINNKNMFSPYDFLVYNAVQRFNADQDIEGFLADIAWALEHSPEFKKWENEIYGAGKSSLSRLYAVWKNRKSESKYKKRMNFQRDLWKILDKVEYDKKSSKQLCSKGKAGEAIIKEKLIYLFQQTGIKILKIKKFNYFDNGSISSAGLLKDAHRDFSSATEEAVYQIEVVIENEAGLPQSVWFKIPLKPATINIKEFKFIYN